MIICGATLIGHVKASPANFTGFKSAQMACLMYLEVFIMLRCGLEGVLPTRCPPTPGNGASLRQQSQITAQLMKQERSVRYALSVNSQAQDKMKKSYREG